MFTIRKETDESYTIEGMSESELLTLYMISITAFWQKKATVQLSVEAFNLVERIEEFYKSENNQKIRYLP